ncbi:MAG: FtsX-like permease family protein [Clostridia bacterium]|nr:FtsX-like permease family protein [Clostridia bacterium]
MLTKKLFRTLLKYKAQFISMIIMIAIGTGVFLGFNMEWYTLQKNTDAFLSETGFADYRIFSETGFSEGDLNSVLSIDGVKAGTRYLSVNTSVKGSDDIIALTVNSDMRVSGVYSVSGENYDSESEDGIWLSDRYAENNGIKLNDAIVLVYNGAEFSFTVKGLIKSGEYMICLPDTNQLMPDYDTYGFAYISPLSFKNKTGGEFYTQINVISDLDKKEFVAAVDNKLGATYLIISKDENVTWSESRGEIEEGQVMGSVLPVLFLVIAVLTMVTTMHRITASEKTQIGTLKALGFKNGIIARHYTSYALAIGVIGTVFGIGIGYLLGWYIMNPAGAMGTYIDMPDWSLKMPFLCWLILIGIIAALTLIGFLSVKSVMKGSAADTLRPYVPKKSKNLIIEKTKLWQKLKFGARWNLRDSVRHKSRTFMTLLGIIGCTVLCVGALGMQDTMDAFVKVFYYDAINYESRINLETKDVTKEQALSVAANYGTDWSASAGVQVGDETLQLEIYHLENDSVKFVNGSLGFTELKDDGAYIASRVADEFNLKAGDEISFAPFGTSDVFTVKVNGIIRSMVKNIVMTDACADNLGVTYQIGTIYTNGMDIEKVFPISGVQNKTDVIKSFDTFLSLMKTMVALLIVAAVILGIVVLYNLGVMSYTERYREMATLKVVGFKNGQIGRILIGQNMWLTVIGIILGIPAGVGVLQYLLNALAAEYEMVLSLGFMTFAVSVLLTFGVSFIVGLMVSKKNKHINMVEALKGVE